RRGRDRTVLRGEPDRSWRDRGPTARDRRGAGRPVPAAPGPTRCGPLGGASRLARAPRRARRRDAAHDRARARRGDLVRARPRTCDRRGGAGRDRDPGAGGRSGDAAAGRRRGRTPAAEDDVLLSEGAGGTRGARTRLTRALGGEGGIRTLE